MQYLLSENEYLDLLNEPKKVEKFYEKQLLETCIQVAIHKPIKFWGREEATPWGCHYADIDSDGYIDYCDECPVMKICPGDKEFSK